MPEEIFFAGLACFTLLSLVGTPIVVLVLFQRSRRLERRVEDLTSQLSALTKLRGGEATAPDPAREVTPEPELVPEPAPAPEPAAAEPPPAVPERYEEEAATKAAPAPAKKKAAPPAARKPGWAARAREVDWERWIGVRGAAVVGGAVLALAAILFFVHAFNEGWIKPPMRVAMGVLLGVACIGFGMRLRRKTYSFAPAALEGAGIVALYATIWAADKRYHMLSMVASFPLMAIVTAIACVLAIRYKSLLTAVLGLVGGFATPLLLSTGSDRPIGLFGYILLLDLGLLFVGKKRSWSIIGLLALLGTFLIQGLWIFGRMGQERVGLGIVIVGVFAVLFAVVGQWIPKEQRKRWMPAQVGGVIFPFVFAFYFSNQLEFRGHVWSNALLLGLLVIAACIVGRMHKAPYLAFGGAAAGVAVVAVWFFEMRTTTEVCWELSAVAVGLALVSHAFAEWERRRDGEATQLVKAASVGALGWSLLLIAASMMGERAPLQAVLLGLLGLAALLVRQAVLMDKVLPVVLASAAVGLAMGSKYAARHVDYDLDARLFALVALALSLGFLALGTVVRVAARKAWLSLALLVGVFLLLLPSRSVDEPVESWFVPLCALVLTLPIAWAAMRTASVLGLLFASSLALVAQFAWSVDFLHENRADGPLTVGFVLLLATAAFHVLWPALTIRTFGRRPAAYVLASVAAFLWSFPLAALYVERFGDALELAPFALAGALALIGGWRVLVAVGKEAGAVSLAWLGGAAAVLVALGLGIQFEEEELTITLALSSLGLAALARWLGTRGPGWVASFAALLAAGTVVGKALDGGHYARSEALVFNVLTYVHLVPALALLGATLLLRGLQPGEQAPKYLRWFFAAVPGLGVIFVLFAWINLEILNFYGEYPRLDPDYDRSQARDLATSTAWGLYALGLLGLGTLKKVMALRWASLVLFFVTIGKVFLHDLGDLEGLYRVGSLAGLAVALIVVSLFYQRFVFRRTVP